MIARTTQSSRHLSSVVNITVTAALRNSMRVADDRERRLLEASATGDFNAVRDIVSEVPPIDLDCRDELEETPLILAARGGYDAVARLLIDAGARLVAVDAAGDDALLAASERAGNEAVLELLLTAGAEIDRRDQAGRTALIQAASIEDVRNVSVLLCYHPDLETASQDEETALTFAVVNDRPDIVRLLVDAGANVDRPDSRGWTPLIYAAYACNARITQQLLEAGADPLRTDAGGLTAFDHAEGNGADNVKQLLTAAAPTNPSQR